MTTAPPRTPYTSPSSIAGQLVDEAEIAGVDHELHHKARLFRRVLAPTRNRIRSFDVRSTGSSGGRPQVVTPSRCCVMVAHDPDRWTAGEAARALRVVESFLVRRMIVGIATTGTNRILMTLVKELGETVADGEGDHPRAVRVSASSSHRPARARSGARKQLLLDRPRSAAHLRVALHGGGSPSW